MKSYVLWILKEESFKNNHLLDFHAQEATRLNALFELILLQFLFDLNKPARLQYFFPVFSWTGFLLKINPRFPSGRYIPPLQY